MLLMTLFQDVGSGGDDDNDVAIDVAFVVHLKMQYMASVNIENFKFSSFAIVVIGFYFFFACLLPNHHGNVHFSSIC